MSITTQHQSLPLRSGSQDAGIGRFQAGTRRHGRARNTRPQGAGVPPVMGPANRAPGVPIMGAPSSINLEVMGGPDRGPHLELMGPPDAGARQDLMGDSDPGFVDALFTPRERSRP